MICGGKSNLGLSVRRKSRGQQSSTLKSRKQCCLLVFVVLRVARSGLGSERSGSPLNRLCPRSRYCVHEAGECWERERFVRIRSESRYSCYRKQTKFFRTPCSVRTGRPRSQQFVDDFREQSRILNGAG